MIMGFFYLPNTRFLQDSFAFAHGGLSAFLHIPSQMGDSCGLLLSVKLEVPGDCLWVLFYPKLQLSFLRGGLSPPPACCQSWNELSVESVLKSGSRMEIPVVSGPPKDSKLS